MDFLYCKWSFYEFMNFETINNNLPNIIIITAIILAGLLIHFLVIKLLKRSKKIFASGFTEYLIPRINLSSRILTLLLITLYIILPILNLPPDQDEKLRIIIRPFTIGVLGWMLIETLLAVNEWVAKHYVWLNVEDNMTARRMNTQIKVLVKGLIFLVVLITFTGIALTIPAIRNLGLSLFASAGVTGLILGVAARPVLSNLIAGFQIAFTQPIRIDDVVIVEGEWGKVEEITSAYVVMRIWDKRRMIVPLSYFIEKPFQNWTHASSDLMGTAMIYVDYEMPVTAVREELQRIVEASPLWDKKVCGLQVTDIDNRTMELRALVSAKNSGQLFDLRCEVREKLLDFIKEKYPQYLPQLRMQTQK